MIDDYSGLQKAAILLITLGPEKASAIFQHLKEDEIESLTLEIANTRSVSPQDKESVLDEYYQVCLAQQYIAEGGIGYASVMAGLLEQESASLSFWINITMIWPIPNRQLKAPQRVMTRMPKNSMSRWSFLNLKKCQNR